MESAKAASSTRNLIEISMEEINKGNAIATDAMNALKDSVSAVDHVNEMIKNTALASSEAPTETRSELVLIPSITWFIEQDMLSNAFLIFSNSP